MSQKGTLGHFPMATLDLLFDGKSFAVTKKSCSELVEQHQELLASEFCLPGLAAQCAGFLVPMPKPQTSLRGCSGSCPNGTEVVVCRKTRLFTVSRLLRIWRSFLSHKFQEMGIKFK
jgi:hypothetical protein